MTHWTEEVYQEKGDTFAFMLEQKFDEAKPEVQSLLQLIQDTRGTQPETVLDVGCGLGRHVIAFAEQGCQADGIDISEPYIERAREQVTERNLEDRVNLYNHDMRDLGELEGSYDLITNLFDTFGYFTKEQDVAILSKIRRLLSDDGMLAMQISNKEGAVRNLWQADVQQFGEWFRVQRLDYDVPTSRLNSTLDVFKIQDDGYEYEDTLELDQRLYSPVEFREMCQTAGFNDVSMFGGFNGGEVTLNTPLFVTLAN